ncbi:hypothetical protein VZ95_05175 [Elstera litoralis]|uniref:RmlD-like substrate binding domain-containing protein n=1 Tax=Elstera litoralis TaxID=552518 RepID=A0A0F3IUL8_9PROT|nr:hypothetical protein [Elstera litoralis]KJV10401.1 hypothetical protein VZ95_05175 [Elstera litoralis]
MLARGTGGYPDPATPPRPQRLALCPDAALALDTLLRAPRLAHRLYHVGPGGRWSLEDWCARLARRYPGLDWALTADPTETNITLPPVGDRAPLDVSRVIQETGFRPSFDLDGAFADFTATVES